jgi:hypothetical protein
MPSLMQRITRFSRSKQGRELMRQVQDQLAGRGRSGDRRRPKRKH